MNSQDLLIGQKIEAGFWFRRSANDKDYALVMGTIVGKGCYNRILLHVESLKCGAHPGTYPWIDCNKADITI